MKKNVLEWIKEVREGCKTTLERDGFKILKIMKKGNFKAEDLYDLLMEIRDNERDDALLCLIEELLIEELRTKKEIKG